MLAAPFCIGKIFTCSPFVVAKIKNGRSTVFSKVVPNKKRSRKEYETDKNVDISDARYKTLHVVKSAGLQQLVRLSHWALMTLTKRP